VTLIERRKTLKTWSAFRPRIRPLDILNAVAIGVIQILFMRTVHVLSSSVEFFVCFLSSFFPYNLLLLHVKCMNIRLACSGKNDSGTVVNSVGEVWPVTGTVHSTFPTQAPSK